MIARDWGTGAAVVLAWLLLVAGSSKLAADDRLAEEPAPNTMIRIDYVEPLDGKWQEVYEQLKGQRFLERYSQFLAPLQLPYVLRLKTQECGFSNAFFDAYQRAITVCYELVGRFQEDAPEGTTKEGITVQDAVVGAVVATMLHETGHALFDFYRIPVLGKEEDAADQAAGFILLQFGSDIALHAINGVLWKFDSAAQRSKWIFSDYADGHSTNAQRLQNFLCLAYGHDPATFRHLAIELNLLPNARAERCAREYDQVKLAFEKTILPHVDPALMEATRARKWLVFDAM
jgi:hypothetical protein